MCDCVCVSACGSLTRHEAPLEQPLFSVEHEREGGEAGSHEERDAETPGEKCWCACVNVCVSVCERVSVWMCLCKCVRACV